ncbi:MAG: DnaA regulatory inactivator Hda [Burkholderiaceae bacterium]
MKQIALDIGLSSGPTLQGFFAGPNEAALRHLLLWVGEKSTAATRSPVPAYLWGPAGSGKTHLLKAVREALREQGATVGWLDPSIVEPGAYQEQWAAVLFDDVQAFSAVQQHAAFAWFVHAQTHQRWALGAGEQAPAALPVRDDLRSRLGWGHVFSLKLLSEPERRSVLRQSADARGVFLRDEVMDFLLKRFSRDLGSLMELLDLIDAYAMQSKRAVTIPMIRAMMEES